MRKTVSLLVSNSVTTGRVMLFIFLQLYCRLLKYKYYICFFFLFYSSSFFPLFSASFSGTTSTSSSSDMTATAVTSGTTTIASPSDTTTTALTFGSATTIALTSGTTTIASSSGTTTTASLSVTTTVEKLEHSMGKQNLIILHLCFIDKDIAFYFQKKGVFYGLIFQQLSKLLYCSCGLFL
nr:integrator complex subunit 2 homolog [Hydra vulgaris]